MLSRSPNSHGTPPFRLSHNIEGLTTSATIAIQERATALRAEGRRVYKLGLGQSPFPVPGPMIEALRAHAGEKDYLPTAGLPALRAAVAQYHCRKPGIRVGADDVLISPGSKELLFLLQVALDGQVLMPTPAWVSYAPQARILGRRIRYIHTSAADGWQLSPDDLDRACHEHDGPYLLVLNDPSNPTGTSHSPERQREIAAVAREHGVIILSDEIYGELRFDGRHRSIAEDWPEGTILATGLSKWCGAGGWRLGAFTFPPGLRGILKAMEAAASETYTTTSAPIQYAAVTAFAGEAFPGWMETYIGGARRVLGRLAAESARRLRAAGARVVDADGAFYLFPDFEPHRARLAARGIHDASALCEQLLVDTGVMCLPGQAFARPRDELTLRLALVDFDGAAALAQVAKDGEGDVSAVAPVLEAIDRLCAWVTR
jgi:aspartate aminotransferase